MKESEENLWDLWDTVKVNDMYIMGLPKEENREKGTENLFKEIMARTKMTEE